MTSVHTTICRREVRGLLQAPTIHPTIIPKINIGVYSRCGDVLSPVRLYINW